MAPTRFVTDSSLALLARRLRVLGYDVVVHRGARLEEMLEAATSDGRVVLTTSARHPRRYAQVAVWRVDPQDIAGAIRMIAAAHEPAGPPFTRCTSCSSSLQRRLAFEARGEVPGRVTRSHPVLQYCPACGKWFWPGSHVVQLTRWLESALGRPLQVPGSTEVDPTTSVEDA